MHGLSPLMIEAFNGLRAIPRALPQSLLYDERGIELYEKIKKSPFYYALRAESELIDKWAGAIHAITKKREVLIDYGGSSVDKAISLFEIVNPLDYIVIDQSVEALEKVQTKLNAYMPKHNFRTHLMEGDFLAEIKLPVEISAQRNFGLCTGLTFCNLNPREVRKAFAEIRRSLGEDGYFLVSSDHAVDITEVLQAYNLPDGSSAAFALNVLERINREGGANFVIESFEYDVAWNNKSEQISMFVKIKVKQEVSFGDENFRFEAGDRIDIVSSYKYAFEKFVGFATKTGWIYVQSWTRSDGKCTLYLFHSKG